MHKGLIIISISAMKPFFSVRKYIQGYSLKSTEPFKRQVVSNLGYRVVFLKYLYIRNGIVPSIRRTYFFLLLLIALLFYLLLLPGVLKTRHTVLIALLFIQSIICSLVFYSHINVILFLYSVT